MAQQLKTNHEIVSDKAKNPVTTSEYIKHGNKWLNDAVNEATVEVTKKANKDYVDAELAKKANAADLTALETTVSGKADSSTVAGISERVTQNTTKTADLQSQIDNLVIEAGGDSNPEVIQARTDAAGVTHTTLKDRIDSEVTDLKGDLSHEIADISIGKNLYDYSRSHAGYIDLQNGSIHDATGSWHYSDRYIPVSVGDVLYANERHFVAYYDTNLNFISGLQIPASLNTTVPASAVFARFSSPSGSKTSVVCKNVYDGAAGSFNYKLNGLNVMYLYPYLVESVSAMPVIDTLADDITIKMNFGKGATAPTNFPFEKFPNYGLYTFTNITNKNNVNNIGGVQTIEFANGRWRRVKSTSWGAWEFSGNNFVYVRHGANPVTEPTIYTSFSQAVILNRDIPNTTIYLNSDTYDIYQELVALYGQDFFDNHTVSGRDGHGLELGSGMTIIGTAKSVIAFNYTGTNNSVMTNYSPIMMPAADCTLKNIKITANNCKYVVHDDPINKGARWEHIYDNVQMVMDNSNNPHGNNYRCIGGGLGNQSTIIIRSCYFEAVGTADTKYLISWHNCVNAAALGSIDIDGCYFSDTGAIRIANYGESTLKTMVLIHNNRLGANTFLTYESSYTIENFAVREYCNSNQ